VTAVGSGLTLENFLWKNGRVFDPASLSTSEDRGAALEGLAGQFALQHIDARGRYWLARDQLGVNKLFYTIDDDGSVVSSNYLIDLLAEGRSWRDVWSVPSGHHVLIDTESRTLELTKYAPLAYNETASEAMPAIEPYARRIRERFESVFRSMREALGGRELFVTLSGGLDSSTIAVLAREYLGAFTAITFAIDPGDGRAPRSEDLATAERLASDLGVPFVPVIVSADEVVDRIDDVLVYGQDWRDFNVHCGLVNACIGHAIGSRPRTEGEPAPVLLTGDTMNELLADYKTESYAGHEFYRLPRLAPARLRRTLVGGLDSGDREIGLFGHYGVAALQPFALCAEELVALPPEHVNSERAKQAIMRQVMGDQVPEYVYARPKTRAQSASADMGGGTLSLLTDRGIDADWLASRFGQLFSIDRDALGQLIRAGFYRSTAKYPE
jgi:asparagine synthetase B (glutamine-hydrolysing)